MQDTLSPSSNELQNQSSPEATYHDTKLPDWVRDLFICYAQGLVSESELLGAFEFLIGNGIIKV